MPNRIQSFIGKPAVRRTFIGLVSFLLLVSLFGYFVLPGIIQSQAEKLITEKLHRQATIGKVEVNPYALSVTVRDLRLMEPGGKAVFVSFDALTINVSSQSLLRMAPVVQQLRLAKPYVHLARNEAHHYNIDDIIALIASQPPSNEPSRYSVYNIQIENGRIEFEDRPVTTTHVVSDLNIGVPFISSLPAQVEVLVEPLLSANVNGAPLLLKGKARPYAEPKEAALELNLDELDLTRYLEYLPFKPAFKVPSARLDAHLNASFQQPTGKAPVLMLTGRAALKSVQLTELNGKPLLKLPLLAVTLGNTDVFGGRIDVARIAVDGLETDLTRGRDGQLNVQHLLPPSSPATAPAATKPAATALNLALAELAIHGAKLRYTDEYAARPVHAAVEKFDLAVRKLALDTGKKTLTVGEVASGSADFMAHLDKPATRAAATAPQSGTLKTEAAEAAYTVNVTKIGIENWSTRIEDHSQPKPVVTAIAPLTLAFHDFSNTAPGRIEMKATVNRGGRITLQGSLGMAPLHTDLALDLQRVDLLALQPYVTDQLNLLLSRAYLSGKGKLQLDLPADGTLKGGYKGSVTLADLATLDKVSSNDFVRWKSLFFGGVDVRLQPLSVGIEQIALNDFFARIIIAPSGRINLQDIVRSHPGDHKSLTEAAATAPVAPPAEQTKIAAPASSPAAGKAPPIKIGKVILNGGSVRFTDNFIKPNYTAQLMDLSGTVSDLSSDASTRASVDLHGQVNSAPLSIVGSTNPLQNNLMLDIKAYVHDMELAPLSPYSGKYVGYGIEKGKLSFEAAYQIENRKLSAQNRLTLNQLTFGDRIDSPSATKLPVHLAVALLRDRNGVIDINLPIGGSLDDPEFSVGGIIVKVFVNLITKAVTSPFALLGSLFGGGEELSTAEFYPGHFSILPKVETKLQSLAKALTERPALKLEITGRFDPATDRASLQYAAVEHKVRALKLKDLLTKGIAVEADNVAVTPEEYPALLVRVFQQEYLPVTSADAKNQPPKIPPVEEMKKLVAASIQISDDELIALGSQRSQAVKDWLLKTGQVPPERVFILATKPGDPAAQRSGASPGRADFSLR